jgi:hypothetical protein
MVHKQVNLFEKRKKRRKFYDEFACVIKLPKLHVKSELMATSPHLRS